MSRADSRRSPTFGNPLAAAGFCILGVAATACAPVQPPPAPAASGSPAAVASSEPTLPPDVVEVTWQWVSFVTPVEQLQVDAPERYTLRFDRAGRLAVRADCNRGTTSYSVSPDRRVEIRPIALTRMACPAGSLSDRFVKEVGRATSYLVKDGALLVELPVDSGTLRFRRQE
jgi:heat shock protein HslJ